MSAQTDVLCELARLLDERQPIDVARFALLLTIVAVGCGGARYARAKGLDHVLEGELGEEDREPRHATVEHRAVHAPVDEGVPSTHTSDDAEGCHRGAAMCLDDTFLQCTVAADDCTVCSCVQRGTSSMPPSPWINPNRPEWPQ